MKNANITIDSIEDKGLQIKIKSGKLSYSFFKKAYQSENDSEAYTEFQGLKVGDRTGIAYTENVKEGITYKNIQSFLPILTEPIARPGKTPAEEPALQAKLDNGYIVTEPKDDRFWDKKGYKQCLWNYWLELTAKGAEKGKASSELTQFEMDLVWQIFNQIEQDADKRFADGVNAEDIPF